MKKISLTSHAKNLLEIGEKEKIKKILLLVFLPLHYILFPHQLNKTLSAMASNVDRIGKNYRLKKHKKSTQVEANLKHPW